MKRTAVHYALYGVNGMVFPICGFRNRSSLRWSGFIGEISCELCLSLLVEAGCLPDPGHHGRARLTKRDSDESGGPDVDDMGRMPSGVLASCAQGDDLLLDFH